MPNGARAVVMLPGGATKYPRDPILRRWLGRADISAVRGPVTLLSRVLEVLGLPAPKNGIAALRLWGQTGERPADWVAGADPVFLEARLDHLCLHRLAADELPEADLETLFAELGNELGSDDDGRFWRQGTVGYLRSLQAMPTPALSADSLDGREPSPFMPVGEDAARFHQLHSEIQMLLHRSPVQSRRLAEARRPLNALWLWGGGRAPEKESRPLPPLYSNEPLLQGFWLSASATVNAPSERLLDCAAETGGAFVTSIPSRAASGKDDPHNAERQLADLHQALQRGSVRDLWLLFDDGVTVRARRQHRFQFWRRAAAPFDTPVQA